MERLPPPKKIEVYVTDSTGKKKIFQAYHPFVTFSFNYPTNTHHYMGSNSPIVEHTGQVEFTFRGSGLSRRPPKPKKPKPLSKRALRKLEEERARFEAEEWD